MGYLKINSRLNIYWFNHERVKFLHRNYLHKNFNNLTLQNNDFTYKFIEIKDFQSLNFFTKFF